MKFDKRVKTKYRDAIEGAVEKILEKGNERHRETARLVLESDILIRFAPLKKIGCSGVAGLVNYRATNKKIDNEILDIKDALAETYITFADWTFDVAGQRGCQGTLVHEGLHACDFAQIISSFSKAEIEPLDVFDLTLYELEHRAAVTSAEYLVLIGEPDYVEEGRQLNLVCLDADGKPCIDPAGILFRMQNGYGLNENKQGVQISKMLGLRPKGEGFSFGKIVSDWLT